MCKKGKERKYFIPIRSGNRVHLEPVSEEVYRGFAPGTWREQKRMRRNGLCHCPQSHLAACDTDCEVCRYYSRKALSLDAPIDDTANAPSFADTLDDDRPTLAELVEELNMLALLNKAVGELTPEERELVQAYATHHSMRDAAKAVEMPLSTFNDQVQKLFRRLRAKLFG